VSRDLRSLLLPVLLAGAVALGAGAVVIFAFGSDGGGGGAAPVVAAAATTGEAIPETEAGTTAAAVPAASCSAFQEAAATVDAALARLVGEDLSGAEGELPGLPEVRALDAALDDLAADAPAAVEQPALALARLLRTPLAPVLASLDADAPAEGEEQLVEALVGLGDVVQDSAYVEASGAVQDWAAAGCTG
jgi:hypothetical protein